jgi:hypothetical protein
MFFMAGPAAERKFVGRSNHVDADNDYNKAIDFASRLYFPGPLLDTYLAFMHERVKETVSDPAVWRMIEAVASELVVTRSMSGKRLRAVCRDASQRDI